MEKTRIAVIGSGISGASAAWLLKDSADVQLFEADDRFGGHTHTYQVQEGHKTHAIDTGFMVFNKPNYPILTALIDHLNLSSYSTSMSFSVSIDKGRLEYAGSGISALFSQKSNLVNPTFWRMLSDIMKFNRVADEMVRDNSVAETSLATMLNAHGFSDAFRHDYLYPMAAAIWSCPCEKIAEFPARSFLQFFFNHGLIKLKDRPHWLTLEGGASSYMNKLIHDLGDSACKSQRVIAIHRNTNDVELVFIDGDRQNFDEVVLACHSDQALSLLVDPLPGEVSVLSAIPYQVNKVYLHTDQKLMPKRKSVWSSWNYLGYRHADQSMAVSVSYWMNSLQRIDSDTNYFVSLNPPEMPREEKVIASFTYDHPVFEQGALQAQQMLSAVQGKDRVWFAGAWTGYGFHEDGLRSGVEVARALGATIPWDAAVKESAALAMVPRLIEQIV